MKTLKFLFPGLIVLGMVAACELTSEEISIENTILADNIQTENLGSSGDPGGGMIKVPFKAKFFTKRSFEDDGIGKCTEDPFFDFNLQIGGGQGTHLGKFNVSLWFCGAGLDYKNGEGVFVAANGDELYFNVPSPGEVGHVLLFDHPFYEAMFQDPFSFIGGTGRFEGASGGGYTNSFVDLFDDDGNFIPEHQTDHKWTGTLIMKKPSI